jgi:hypothetical protein
MKNLALWSLVILLFASSCREMFGRRIRGNGHVNTESRSTSSFSSVDVSGAIDVYVKQDSLHAVKVEADENLLEYVEVHNENGTLHIHERNGVNLKPSHKIKVYVAGPDFRRFEASGACKIFSENQVSGSETLKIDLSGACEVNMDVKAPKVDAGVSGACQVELKGQTRDFKVSGSGSTDVRCFDLLAENTEVRITGAGEADVFASVKLDVHVSGAGSVKYRGNATVNQQISGAGSVKKAD